MLRHGINSKMEVQAPMVSLRTYTHTHGNLPEIICTRNFSRHFVTSYSTTELTLLPRLFKYFCISCIVLLWGCNISSMGRGGHIPTHHCVMTWIVQWLYEIRMCISLIITDVEAVVKIIVAATVVVIVVIAVNNNSRSSSR